jgi:hypothetical protein
MQLNPKYPVQLKKVYINELVAFLNLVNNHLSQIDQSYKKIKDQDLDQAYRHIRVVCKRWNEKVNEMQLTGRTTYTTRIQLQQFIPLYHLYRLLVVGQPVSDFAQQMLYRLDQHYQSLLITQAGLVPVNYQRQYRKITQIHVKSRKRG